LSVGDLKATAAIGGGALLALPDRQAGRLGGLAARGTVGGAGVRGFLVHFVPREWIPTPVVMGKSS